MEDLGGTGGRTRGGTIGHVCYLAFSGRRGEAGHLLGTDRSDGERRQIYQQAVSEEAAKIVAGAATVTPTETKANTMKEGEWDDPPAT